MLAWNSSGLRQINEADAFASRPFVATARRSSAELPRLQMATAQMVGFGVSGLLG